MSETAKDVLQYGSLGLLFLAGRAVVLLSLRSGRAVWATVSAFLAGLLAEFKASNAALGALDGHLSTATEINRGEHVATRAHVSASVATVIREVGAAADRVEEVVRQRTSDVRDEVRASTGEQQAVNVDRDPAPRRPLPSGARPIAPSR